MVSPETKRPVHQDLDRLTLSDHSTEEFDQSSSVSTDQMTAIEYTEIGRGQCGTVYSMTATGQAFKAMNPDKRGPLRNDYMHHVKAASIFLDGELGREIGINIPKPSQWVTPEDIPFWDEHLDGFPAGYAPMFGFQSQEIFGLDEKSRERLFDEYAPKTLKWRKSEILEDPENQHCLIRLYLGRRGLKRSDRAFRLRNFGLAVDEMRGNSNFPRMVAQVMGQALAVLHWKVGIDANDVEFVMNCTKELDVHRLETSDTHLNCPSIWLLDFDQCQAFRKDEDGLKQLVRGFFFNDPYYPRPGQQNEQDECLWDTFKNWYLEISYRFEDGNMPKRFISEVEREGAKRAGKFYPFD